jgi:uncharacterized membrane protein
LKILFIIGVIISIVILKQESGIETAIGNAFCSGDSEKKDCDAVLASKGAEVLKGYKLSDFCILYFATLAISTIVQIKIDETNFLYLISCLAIPATIYSIYYQYFILKNWCLLCVTVVGILWLQLGLILLTNEILFSFEIIEILIFLSTFSFVVLSWSFLKPMISNLNSLRKENIKSSKFTKNFEIFNSFLNKSAAINTKIENTPEIIFGNLESNTEILIITNPFCGHCKSVHEVVDEILIKYKSEIKIIVRFNISTDSDDSDGVKVTTRLLEIYRSGKTEECLLAMNDIYGRMKTNLWLDKWGVCNEKEKLLIILKEEKKWCIENGINFTPEILINGKAYPKQYKKSELVFFIEELTEENNKR